MSTTRPFTPEAVRELLNSFRTLRDQVLFTFMLATGFRIEEARGLRVGDVWADGHVRSSVSMARRRMKGGKGRVRKRVRGREVVLNPVVQAQIQTYIGILFEGRVVDPNAYLFCGRQVASAGGWQPISRGRAYQIIRDAAEAIGIESGVGTHSMRKTFAHAVYEKSGHDIVTVQHALDHRSVATTARYLAPSRDTVDELIRSLEVPIGLRTKPPEAMNLQEMLAVAGQSEFGAPGGLNPSAE